MTTQLRMVQPDKVYEVVTGTVDRQFLFRPNGHPLNPLLDESCPPDAMDPKIDTIPRPSVLNIIGYAFARALELKPVRLHSAEQHLNHIHSCISADNDHVGNISKFYRVAHSIIAKELNRLFEREGHVFAGKLRATPCEDDESAKSKLIYGITNIVKDGLLDRQNGKVFLSSFPTLSKGQKLKFWKINWRQFHQKGGFRIKSHRPKDYLIWRELDFSWLAGYLSWSESKRQTRIRKQVALETESIQQALKRKGQKPLGLSALKSLDPRDRPRRPRNKTPKPLCHASTIEGANAYREQYRQFATEYIAASAEFRNGNYQREFPQGSYRPPLMKICTADGM